LKGVPQKHESASDPVAPDGFIRPDHYLLSAANERKPEDHRLLGEPRQPALVRHLRVAQAELIESAGLFVDECHYAEFLREASQLADRRGFLHEVDKMSPNASLGEKSKRFARIGAFLDSEDLDFQSNASRLMSL
jgi:hypothetical protein